MTWVIFLAVFFGLAVIYRLIVRWRRRSSGSWRILDFKDFIRDDLLKLSFVRWDRFVDDGDRLCVFGWIDRPQDAYKDFVVLVYLVANNGLQGFYITSSKGKTLEISECLGIPTETHMDCQRVEDTFDITNVCRVERRPVTERSHHNQNADPR